MDAPGAPDASGSTGGAGITPDPGAGAAHPRAVETTWRRAFDGVLGGLGNAASARLRVIRLEVRRALRASAAALVLCALALLMLLTAWFALIGAVVAAAVAAGLQWPWVLLAVAVVCVILGWLALRTARASLAAISFDGSVRVLQRHASPGPTVAGGGR